MSKLIVAVDDSRTVRASLKYTLKKHDYEIEMAENGKEGLKLLEKLASQGKKPGMIISDINMPVMGGIEFIKEVKSDRKFKFIPVLVLTTESQQSKKMEGKKAGAAGWLVKPFDEKQLLGVVKKFVK